MPKSYARRGGQSTFLDDIGLGDFRDAIPTPPMVTHVEADVGLAVRAGQPVVVEFSDGTIKTVVPLNDRIIGSGTVRAVRIVERKR